MALTVKVDRKLLTEYPELDTLGHQYRAQGGKNRGGNGKVIFKFSHSDIEHDDMVPETLFAPEHYALCNQFGLQCEGGMFYHIFTLVELVKEVPESYPDRLDENGEVHSYASYFRKDTQYDLGDGTYLFKIQKGLNALTDADRLTYQSDLGTLLVKAEGVAKIPTNEEI